MALANTQSANESTRTCICISDVVTTPVYSEKTRLKKLMMIMIMNKSQETMVFGGCQKLTSAMKLRLEK